MLVVDWSTYQDPTEEQIAGLAGAGVGKVVLQLGGSKGEIDKRIWRWASQCKAAGLQVEAYLPPWWAKDAAIRAYHKGRAARFVGFDRLWVDVEDDTVNDLDDLSYTPVQTLVAVLGALVGAGWPKSRLGIYASPTSWGEVMGDAVVCPSLALWLASWRPDDADWDGSTPVDFSDFDKAPFGGWRRERVAMQQYTGTVLGPTGFPVDFNWCP